MKFSLFFIVLFFVSCEKKTKEAPPAKRDAVLYFNGDILTMNGETPQYAEAVVTEGKKIAFVGEQGTAMKKYEDAKQVDLKGKTMLPGFIDPHGHFSMGINMVSQVNVSSPPVGGVTDYASLIDTLQHYQQQKQISEGEWIVGYGYDQEGLEEKKHITVNELDKAFPNHKLVLIHVSGHGAVLNSNALEWAGIDENTPTPKGGIIARLEDGSNRPAGLIMETPYEPVFASLPKPSESDMLEMLDEVQQMYASEGYTHAQDGASLLHEMRFLKKAAEANKLYIDVVVLPIYAHMNEWIDNPEFKFGEYHNHLKFQGVKFVQDGSPQGKTAYLTKPYLTGGPNGQKNWYGEPTLPKEQFIEWVQRAYQNNLQVFVHANGDATIDHLIEAVKVSGISAADDKRTVAIHSQIQRPDHLPEYVALGITPSYFTNHVFYWGDVHIKNLGKERAAFISPVKSADSLGLTHSNHVDFNVTPLDPFHVIWTATNRETRSGITLGPDQKVATYTALQGITTGPAFQVFEENRKGMIKEGHLADLVILEKNPLKQKTSDLRDNTVLETVKEGKTVFKK